MEQSVQAPSYVSGFNYKIADLNVSMTVAPFVIGNESYETVRYKGIYDMALVKFSLKFRENTVDINIPFYQSSGTNSSRVGVGTWFPFHCVSQKTASDTREYYFRSEYGTSYLFKIGHYFVEPFSGRCDDLSLQVGTREIATAPANSTCVRQRNFLIGQTSEVPKDILYPEVDKGIGVHTILQRFGNLLYLTASYFLFGNSAGWNPANFRDGSQERAFATVLNRISSHGRFGNKTWEEIVSQLPRTPFNPKSYYPANTSNLLNFVLTDNNVAMPHYQDVLRMDNSPDARFLTYMKLLQMVGELYLEPGSIPLWERFVNNFERAHAINDIKLTDQSNLKIGNDFRVWLVPEMFSENNTLVRLYRFV